MGEREVTVDVSPDGVMDNVMDGEYLVRPHQRQMPFSDFVDVLEGKATQDGVGYIQQQQNNLQTEFDPLAEHVPSNLPLARDTLQHTATNLWMGGPDCVSSLHFDLYENIVVVLSGVKEWVIYPPSDLPFLYLNQFQEAQWLPADDPAVLAASEEDREEGSEQDARFVVGVDPDADRVPWLPIDPARETRSEYLGLYPRALNARPLRVTLHPGEALFVPATWLHSVTQKADSSGAAVAINYWYEPHNVMSQHYFTLMAQTDWLLRRGESTSAGSESDSN